jgi:multiple sugar transport system substrate-binding protein
MLEERIKLFEQSHPGVKVNLMLESDHTQKMLVTTAAGVSTDVYIMGSITSAMLRNIIAQGVMQDLYPFFQKDTSLALSDFYPLVMNAHVNKNSLIALPIGILAHATFVNTTILDESGAGLPAASWNWNDLLALAKKTTRVGADGQLTQWGYATNSNNLRDAGAELFLWANGGDILDVATRKFTLDRPEAQQALQFYFDLFYANHVALRPDEGYSYERFWQGKVAIWDSQSGNIAYNRQRSVPGMEWDIVPAVKSPYTGLTGAYLNAYGVGIPSTSKNPDLAWEFIEFAFYTDDAQRELVAAGMLPPLRRFASYYARNIGTPPNNITPVLDNLNAGARAPVWIEDPIVDKTVWDTLNREWTKVMKNEQSVRAFTDIVKPLIETALAQMQ